MTVNVKSHYGYVKRKLKKLVARAS